MKCIKCNYELKNDWKLCPKCGESIIHQKRMLQYESLYGVWEVTTEGDEEGKTTKQLGIHTGFVDEIAFKLGKFAFYSLQFSPAPDNDLTCEVVELVDSVNIHFDIDSKTWDMGTEKRTEYFKKLFKNRPVLIKDSNYYACVKLISSNFLLNKL